MATTSTAGTGPLPSTPPEAASGILLLGAAAVALAWANSPWAQSYVQLRHTPLGNRIGEFTLADEAESSTEA